MCILVTKKDEHGNPVPAKSRIVVLGNKDPHQWTKGYCFAPVATQAVFRLLVSLAIEHNKFSQQGYCKNAFCNTVMPDDEFVILCPPSRMPILQTKYVLETPQNTLWTALIIQTLVLDVLIRNTTVRPKTMSQLAMFVLRPSHFRQALAIPSSICRRFHLLFSG
jgi:hypothetical protein